MANFVLIHGAWGGAETWAEVPARLRAMGHQVLCEDLPGQGARESEKHPGLTLTDFIDDVCGKIAASGFNRFVVAGHSFGGMVATGVASRLGDRIDGIAYLDAFLPGDGESLWDVTGDYEHAWYIDSQKHTPGLVTPIFGEEALEQPGVSRQPLLTLLEAVTRGPQWDAIPRKAYLFANAWEPTPFRRFATAVQTDPAWSFAEVPTSHWVMGEAPEQVVETLASLSAAK
ncbi:alpha/beta fold hydrolase [Parerythrobacter aestuarii]|uniref:alpha/beta fold hydrolase n=1 Tax=Parerythrobacter aestuarii TaxID=3020909 RepID=UPI0024DE95AA|nr:alpha/beta hydrolase [Parerythrobacter aestuarii]